MTTTLTSTKSKDSLIRDKARLWELYAAAFGTLHTQVQFEFEHPDGGGVCFTDANELRDRCKDIAELALYSASYALRYFDEQSAVENFNKKL